MRLDGTIVSNIPQFPKWKYVYDRPYTMIDDSLFVIYSQNTSKTVAYSIIKVKDPYNGDVIYTKIFDITEENLTNLSKNWELIKDILPSLIMESLL